MIFLEEVTLTKVMVTHAIRERGREREETSTTRQSHRTLQGDKTTNSDDLNTRIIQVKSQPFSLILLPFYKVLTWVLQRKRKKQKTWIHEVWFEKSGIVDERSMASKVVGGDPRHLALLSPCFLMRRRTEP